jgi:Fur family ferric uptake transcriptional regulator
MKPKPTPDAPVSIPEAWAEFRVFLKQREERVTEPRRIVLEKALTRRDHFRADELVSQLARGAQRVSRGTVYRTLGLLVQAGMIREIRDSDMHVHYEPSFGRQHHEHMVCDRCGRFIEFRDAEIGVHIDQACRTHTFRQRTHRVVVFGLCRACQSAAGSTRTASR